MAEKDEQNLKKALASWFEQSGLSLPEVASRMEYGYPYIWNLIRGSAPVTDTLLGRFARVFGPAETEKILALAGYVYTEVKA